MTLGDFLDLLRLKGVKAYKGPSPDGAIEVELGLSVDNIEDAKPGTVVDPDACRCGHPPYAHMNGLCVQGCSVEMCAGPNAAPEVK